MWRSALKTSAVATAVVIGLSGSARAAAPADAATRGDGQHKGAAAAGRPTNVPEPASLAVLAIGGCLVLCRRKR